MREYVRRAAAGDLFLTRARRAAAEVIADEGLDDLRKGLV